MSLEELNEDQIVEFEFEFSFETRKLNLNLSFSNSIEFAHHCFQSKLESAVISKSLGLEVRNFMGISKINTKFLSLNLSLVLKQGN